MAEQFYGRGDQEKVFVPRRASMPRGVVITLVVLVLVVVLGLIGYFVVKGNVAKTGNGYEVAMNKAYATAIIKLTGYYTKTEGALNIANANAKAIENIIRDAMTGHYGTPADFQAKGLYTAIFQAYPQTGSASQAYRDAETILVGSFGDYQDAQLALYTVVQSFNLWKANSDIFLPLAAGYPDALLSTQVGNQPGVCCQDALAQMSTIIADQNTINAVKTKVLPTLTVPTPAP